MDFQFATAGRIIFGTGTISNLPEIIAETGTRPFFITGNSRRHVKTVSDGWIAENLPSVYQVSSEPTIEMAVEAAKTAREFRCDVVVGIGGGSVVDTAKAVAALMTNLEDILQYLEVIGKGKPLQNDPVPSIAVPTTAGTGAEVTRNAVLSSRRHGAKVSLRHPLMLPKVALIDPALTYSMPPGLTARTGLDALTQVLEPYVSHQANPITDALCVEALQRVSRALPRVWQDGNDDAAREEMCIVSLFGGLALANAKLGAVHGFAAAIGGLFDIPHGLVCARLLPYVTEANIQVLYGSHERQYLTRYQKAAALLTGEPDALPLDCVTWLRDLSGRFAIPSLARYGIERRHFSEIVERTQRASSIKGNPVQLSTGHLDEILEKAVFA